MVGKAAIDAEVKKIIDECFENARRLLRENADKLAFVAEYLITHETMDGDQFRHAMESAFPTVEALEAIAEEKKAKSRKANAEQAQSDKENAEREQREAERLARRDEENDNE